MPHGELKINGRDAYDTWGISLDETGLSKLMTPAPHKEPVQNKNMAMNGTHIVGSVALKDVRTVSLPMHITSQSRGGMLSQYAAFCTDVLDTGYVNIWTRYQPSIEYHFIYEDCQQFQEFMLDMAKFTLSLTEPDPTARSITTSNNE